MSSVSTPVKMLKEFKKIGLNPGENKSINFSIPIKELGLWDANMNFVIEPGEFEIMIGSSSQDIRQKKTISIFK